MEEQKVKISLKRDGYTIELSVPENKDNRNYFKEIEKEVISDVESILGVGIEDSKIELNGKEIFR